MTLPGGPANKLGNRYEKWWTLSEFVRMLHGDTNAIRIEDLGVEKVEFVVTVGSRREFHQAKRSHPTGKWSLGDLSSDGLLQAIGDQLAGNDDQFVFASGSHAHELDDLCQAASHAESLEEFSHAFLKAKGRKDSFNKLIQCWKCDGPTAVSRLRRINVETINDRQLEQKTLWGVRALFIAKSNAVVEALRGIAEDSVHRTIIRQHLEEELSRRGHTRRHVSDPENAGFAVEMATDHYLETVRNKLIQQKLLPKEATTTLLGRLGNTATESVLTGRAGTGKTACVLEVVESLRARGIAVLAFRLDRVPSVSNTADLGVHLKLEESPSLVLAAASEAAGQEGVLIIDQLDAVSSMSGRSYGAFDLVENLLHEVRGIRPRATIHIVVACRAFDWENDSRLRGLARDPDARIDVEEFTTEQVQAVLVDVGFDPTLFHARQLELLRLPQNLSLFLEAGFDPSRRPAFDTSTRLFDQYWKKKRELVGTRGPEDQWMGVIRTLCDEMNATQELSIPKEKLDEIQPNYLHSMASEGVINFDGHRYGFGHESFFDYCFARMFLNRSESLVSFLEESEQHLFRRAQVRQVLTYLRDTDHDRYVRELRDLLHAPSVRPHIKELGLALLMEVPDPTLGEWKVWEPLIRPTLNALEGGRPNPDKISSLAWCRFLASPSWFEFANSRGLVKAWLASDREGLVDEVLNSLQFHQGHSPDSVVALLEPHVDSGGEWPKRLRSFMEWVQHGQSRRLFDLFLRLIENGVLDQRNTVNASFWDSLHGLDDRQPEWIPEVLAGQLRRQLAVSRAAEKDLRQNPLLGYDHSAAEMFEKSANLAPAKFVEHVLPAVLSVSDSTLISSTPPKYDAVWWPLVKSKYSGDETACLFALAGALSALASKDPLELQGIADDLRCRETHVANHLLLALYGSGVTSYSDEALSTFCEEPWRFECGFSGSQHWCAAEAIRAVCKCFTAEKLGGLEATILSYFPPYERTRAGHKFAGSAQFALLAAIPSELRSTEANRRFRELERKFPKPEAAPQGVRGGWVQSPINEDSAEKMTDDQWLRAVAKYDSEGARTFSPDGAGVKGGALELARMLKTRVEKEPDRFASLSLRFPPATHPFYMMEVLAALTTAKVPSDLKLQVCVKSFVEFGEHCGREIADVIGSIQDPLPDFAVGALHWLATEHPDPTTEAWRKDDRDGQPPQKGDLLTAGINTTRGRAVAAIGDLILHDAAYIDRFRPTLDKIILDPNISVLSWVARTLQTIAYRNPQLGVQLFQCMNLYEDRLLATSHVYEFIFGNLHNRFAEFRPLIGRMIRSSEPDVCKAGARLASLANLGGQENAEDLAKEAMNGNGRHRLGVAQVATANIAVPGCSDWSAATLIELFDDEDAEVRRVAASCFHRLHEHALESYEGLITAFCDSKAFQTNSYGLIHLLEDSPERLPGMTCQICEKFLDRFNTEVGDPATGQFADTPAIARVIFRTYQQHQHDEWTSPSLDLIDRLCLANVGGVGGQFAAFER